MVRVRDSQRTVENQELQILKSDFIDNLVHQTVKVRDYKNESLHEFTVDSDTN